MENSIQNTYVILDFVHFQLTWTSQWLYIIIVDFLTILEKLCK